MLKPDKILLVNFEFYNGFKQHPEWYEEFDVTEISGFISDKDVIDFVSKVDSVLTAETFYNNNFIQLANARKVKTYNQYNYEFFDALKQRHLLIPTKILSPSQWHFQDMSKQVNPGTLEYLPPPTFVEDYEPIREINMARTGKKRFLHVAGKRAAHDRAGTQDLLDSLKYSSGDFELVIKVQKGDKLETSDPRVILDYTFPEDEKELYKDFDLMVQPRRYGGLNLPMNEALSSGLPVIMTGVPPNNSILPIEWLVPVKHAGVFEARAPIDLWAANLYELGARLDHFSNKELDNDKIKAYNIARDNFSPEVLLPKYESILR
jgi:glycosyltransferase involved in cell wall biosynthesis